MIELIKDWFKYRKIKVYKTLEEKYRELYYGAVYSIDFNNRHKYLSDNQIYNEHVKYVNKYREAYLKYSKKTLNDLMLDPKYIDYNSEQ